MLSWSCCRLRSLYEKEIGMKKIFATVFSLCLIASLAACGASESKEEPVSATVEEITADSVASIEEVTEDSTEELEEVTASASEAEPEEPEADEKPEKSDEKVLVAVFSATGNTKKVAEKIAAFENADLYEIVPTEIYTDADLNYGDRKSRSTLEQNDLSARPEIGSDPIDISEYTKIYVGYPIWFAIEPRIMDTFVESYNFTGKTVIPFCTSGSSGIGKSGTNLESLAGTGNWLSGKRFMSAVTDEKIKEWIDSIEY